MKRVISYIVVLAIGAAAGASGYWRLFECGRQPEIRIVEKEKIISVPVYRNYETMTRDDLQSKLSCYDVSAPRLDAAFKNNTAYLSAGLCDRNWTREIKYEINQSGSWKLFVGGIFTAAASYGSYKLWRLKR